MLAKDLETLWHSSQHQFLFTLFPLSPGAVPIGVIGKWAQVDIVHKMDLCHSGGTLSIGNFNLYTLPRVK